MARQYSVAVENNFTKGLITEATGLNFPENACTETFDCVFNRTGNVTRRLGIELEDQFESFENDFTGKAVTEYLWESIGQNGDVNLFVLQIGSTISFFGMNSDGSVSPTLKSFSVILNDTVIPGATQEQLDQNHAQFTHGYGKLWITHPFIDPVQVEYDSATDAITKTRLVLQVRDVDGVPNLSATTNQPMLFNQRPSDSEISQVILYNLYNQGWGVRTAITADGKKWGADLHPLALWKGAYAIFGYLFGITGLAGRSDWPSEADEWFSMKQIVVPQIFEGDPVPPIPPAEAFCMQSINKIGQPQAPAAKGHYLLDAFNEDRYTATHLDRDNPCNFDGRFDLTAITGNGILGVAYYNRNAGIHRPSTCAFHAGRIFYGGVDHEKYTGDIFFSQIIDKFVGNAHKCYQHNDPTTEGQGDLLANDGGIVRIPAMARLVKLISAGTNLIAFATNGIWRIGGSGGENAGFAANDYAVSKISEVGCISPLSIVKTDMGILFWNYDGLWLLAFDPNTGVSVKNIALNSIQTYIDAVPSSELRYIKGQFNPVSKVIQWLHRSTASSTVEERYVYDRILNLDETLSCFYPWTIPDTCMKVVGFIVVKGAGIEVTDSDVLDNSDAIVIDPVTGENVTTDTTTQVDISSRFKYVVRNDCEAIVIPDDTGTVAGYTANPLYIGQYQMHGDFSSILMNPNSGIIVGEDGKYYVLQVGTTATRFRVSVINLTDSTVQEITNATFAADGNSVTGLTFTSSTSNFWFDAVLAPLPFTPYFYMIKAGTSSPMQGYCSMYKINAAGAVEFVGAFHVKTPHVGYMPSGSNTVFTCGVGFAGPNTVSSLARPLYVAVNGLSTPVNGSYYSGILCLPSVNQMAAISGSVNVDWESLFVTNFGEGAHFFMQDNHANNDDNGCNKVFFLDASGGDTMVCMYVNKGTAQHHIADPLGALTDPTIYAMAVSNPNGFIMAKRIQPVGGGGAGPLGQATGGWENWNSHFQGSAAHGFPAPDIGINKDGTTTTAPSYYTDWQSPTVQPRSTADGTSYLTFGKRYGDLTTVNGPPTGSYGGVMTYLWDSATEVGTFIDYLDENLYLDSAINDPGWSVTYPTMMLPFLSPAFDKVYRIDYVDENVSGGTLGQVYVLFQMADFTGPATITTQPVSLSFAEYVNTNYTDWEQSLGGEDYVSYFNTGYKLRGEAIRKWQDNYFQVYGKTDLVHQTSVFDIHAKWDYANVGDTGRWSVTQRVTIDDPDYEYGTKRLKVRGHGKAMQFKVTSVDRNPFNMIGWSSWDSVNAKP